MVLAFLIAVKTTTTTVIDAVRDTVDADCKVRRVI
jgi:hypothetical protein